jgi:aldose 1-epimerase
MITEKQYGVTRGGEAVTEYTVTNGKGMSLTAINYGCIITKLIVPDHKEKPTDVCLGYDTLEEYETRNDGYFGAVIGSFANRLENAEFDLNGVTYNLAKNDGPNHLHGGVRGFDKYVWHCVTRGDELIFTRVSPDGEEGYPGNVPVTATTTTGRLTGAALKRRRRCLRPRRAST